LKEEKPKIAMIIGSLLRYGGTEKHFLQLLQGLGQDFEFTVYHLNPKTGKAYDLISNYSAVVDLNFKGTFSGLFYSINSAFKGLRKQAPDLIYSTSLIGLILILPYSVIFRVPIISARRSLYSSSIFTWSKMIKRLIFWINNIASTKIIGNSEAVEKLTLSEAFSKKKYLTIKNGIDLRNFNKADERRIEKFREEFQLSTNDFIIGSVGNYRKVKNHRQVIEAAKIISRENNAIKFIILGDGTERDNLENMIRQYGLKESVTLTGYRSDLIEALELMDIFVMTSISEGSPNALIEAFAMKKLVIATNVPSINEIIKQGENGFLVELYDNYALANQILRIFEDYDSMKIIKEEAFNTVIKDFDLENNLVKFKNSFYDVIG
tara:strand:+ start:4277 stop:5413 length:1137 start_codon:yes stop_codon:yes gene_type:complete